MQSSELYILPLCEYTVRALAEPHKTLGIVNLLFYSK